LSVNRYLGRKISHLCPGSEKNIRKPTSSELHKVMPHNIELLEIQYFISPVTHHFLANVTGPPAIRATWKRHWSNCFKLHMRTSLVKALYVPHANVTGKSTYVSHSNVTGKTTLCATRERHWLNHFMCHMRTSLVQLLYVPHADLTGPTILYTTCERHWSKHYTHYTSIYAPFWSHVT
jgi:hypothetical protein